MKERPYRPQTRLGAENNTPGLGPVTGLNMGLPAGTIVDVR